MVKMKSRYTYLSHDHDLVAGEVMLFDSLSENSFGTTIRIYLVIIANPKVRRSKPLKDGKGKRGDFNAHWQYQKY
jgi:hypothetical protein